MKPFLSSVLVHLFYKYQCKYKYKYKKYININVIIKYRPYNIFYQHGLGLKSIVRALEWENTCNALNISTFYKFLEHRNPYNTINNAKENLRG